MRCPSLAHLPSLELHSFLRDLKPENVLLANKDDDCVVCTLFRPRSLALTCRLLLLFR